MAGAAVAVLVVLAIIGAIADKTGHSTTGSVARNPGTAVAIPDRPGTPAGYTTFSSASDRFTIALPESWRSVDISSPGAQAAMNELEQANPKLRSVLGQSALHLAEAGMVLMAINPVADPQGFASNVNVVAKPDLGYSDRDLDQIAAGLPDEYAKLGGSLTGRSYVMLDGRRSLRVTGTLLLHSPDGAAITVHQTQFYLGANDLVFAITLSGDDPALPRIASSFATQ